MHGQGAEAYGAQVVTGTAGPSRMEPIILVANARRVAGRVKRKARRTLKKVVPSPPPQRRGLVEEFTATDLAGWVEVPASSPAVGVGLYLNDLEVASAWAIDTLPDRRAPGQVRSFRLALRDIWQYSKKSDRLTVRVSGVPLPIAGYGMYRAPGKDGPSNVEALRKLLDSGRVFGQFGRLQLSKSYDVQWQKVVMGVYERVQKVVKEEFGHDTFFCYGTLLGAVRERGFIGHDLDFDAAFVSGQSDGPSAAAELQQIGFKLIEAGLDVTCMRTALHIHDPASPSARVDLFHLYFDSDGKLAFPFGVAGTTEISKEEWQGTRDISFAGGTGQIPANSLAMVEHIYGANWRTPKPGFRWQRERTKRAPGNSMMPIYFGIEVYWENFYTFHTTEGTSTFFARVTERPDLPQFVVDLGCGDGRDSCGFAATGSRVIGLDHAQVGLRHAEQHARELGLEHRVDFRQCDFRQADALRGHLRAARAECGDAPLLFYGRFLLTAIQTDTQKTMLSALRDNARPGDLLALEFRTDKDETLRRASPRHFRKLQSASAVSDELNEYGFTVVDLKEGTGLSPYLDEDPEVCWLMARFGAAQEEARQA
jgi:SAM-dependent methyltransferase